ncbi:MAG TPA: gluconate 2-dehydrogenase subunit 3 family protein [Povalibacter sp.]
MNTRRSFLLASGGTVSALWLATHGKALGAAVHAAEEAAASATPASFSFFNAADAADVDAIASCIIPSSTTAGAHEARVVVFIDRALHTFFAERGSEFRQGLAEFQKAYAAHSSGTFAAANAAGQIAFLETVDDTPFFGAMSFMTVMGFLASPKYGGNSQRLGWKAIGFEDQHIFVPPFGYYDRDYPGFQPYPGTGAAK